VDAERADERIELRTRRIDIVEPDVADRGERAERGFERRQRDEPTVRHNVKEPGFSHDQLLVVHGILVGN
jgi:hypothetical protein